MSAACSHWLSSSLYLLSHWLHLSIQLLIASLCRTLQDVPLALTSLLALKEMLMEMIMDQTITGRENQIPKHKKENSFARMQCY